MRRRLHPPADRLASSSLKLDFSVEYHHPIPSIASGRSSRRDAGGCRIVTLHDMTTRISVGPPEGPGRRGMIT